MIVLRVILAVIVNLVIIDPLVILGLLRAIGIIGISCMMFIIFVIASTCLNGVILILVIIGSI